MEERQIAEKTDANAPVVGPPDAENSRHDTIDPVGAAVGMHLDIEQRWRKPLDVTDRHRRRHDKARAVRKMAHKRAGDPRLGEGIVGIGRTGRAVERVGDHGVGRRRHRPPARSPRGLGRLDPQLNKATRHLYRIRCHDECRRAMWIEPGAERIDQHIVGPAGPEPLAEHLRRPWCAEPQDDLGTERFGRPRRTQNGVDSSDQVRGLRPQARTRVGQHRPAECRGQTVHHLGTLAITDMNGAGSGDDHAAPSVHQRPHGFEPSRGHGDGAAGDHPVPRFAAGAPGG